MIYPPMDWEYSYKMSWKTFLSICFHCKSIKQNSQHTRVAQINIKNLFLKCQISIFKGGCSGSPGAVSTIYHPTTISAKSLSTWQHHFQKAFTEQQKHTGNWVHVHNLVSLIFWAAMTKPSDVHGGGYAMGILYGFVFLLYFSVALLLLWFCSVPKNWDRMKKRW